MIRRPFLLSTAAPEGSAKSQGKCQCTDSGYACDQHEILGTVVSGRRSDLRSSELSRHRPLGPLAANSLAMGFNDRRLLMSDAALSQHYL